MSFEQILETIYELGKRRGFYARLYEVIGQLNEDEYNTLRADLEGQGFESLIDIIEYFEW